MFYWFLRFVAWALSLPSEKSIDRFAWLLARLLFDVLKARRKLILKNLDIAFGKEKSAAEREEIGRKSVYHFLCTILEFLRSRKDDIARHVSFNNAKVFQDVLARGQGIYVLCFHMGNWEAMGAAMSRTIVPSHVVVKKVGGEQSDRFVSELRALNGFLTVKRTTKGSGFRAIQGVIEKGEVVGFVMDQARPGEPRLPFFGVPAKTNTSFAAIWQRTPAPVMPGFVVRKAFGVHEVEFLPELEMPKPESLDSPEKILALTQRFNDVVEACVRRCPEQYFWMHNRWK